MAPSLRPMGKDELYFTLRNNLGYYHNVALSISLIVHEVAEEGLLRLVYAALARVVDKHPILFAVPVLGSNAESIAESTTKSQAVAHFERLPNIKLSDVVSTLVRNDASIPSPGQSDSTTDTIVDEDLDSVLQGIHNTAFEEGQAQWRVFVRPVQHESTNPSNAVRFTLTFVYHHVLGDGLSGIAFLNDFVDALAQILINDDEYGECDEVFAKDDTLLPYLECWKRSAATPAEPSQQKHEQTEQSEPDLSHTSVWLGKEPRNKLPLTSRFVSFTLSPRTTQRLLSTVSQHKTSLTPFLQTLFTACIFHVVEKEFDRVDGLCSFSFRPYLEACPVGGMGLFVGGCRTKYLRDRFHDNEMNGKGDIKSQLTKGTGFWGEVDRTKRSVVTAVGKAVEALPASEMALEGKGVDEQTAMVVWMKSLINSPRVASFDINNIGRLDSKTLSDKAQSRMTLGRVIFSASQSAIGSAFKVNVVTGPRGDMTIGVAWQDEVHDEDVVLNVVAKFRSEMEQIE